MEEKPTLYVETTIPSYLVSRPRRDAVGSVYQQSTLELWPKLVVEYRLVTSNLVIQECSLGDDWYALLRRDVMKGIPRVAETEEVIRLTTQLVSGLGLPARLTPDATHVALCSFHRVEYLLTWNCKHLANAKFAKRIARICTDAGHSAPVICTPIQLM